MHGSNLCSSPRQQVSKQNSSPLCRCNLRQEWWHQLPCSGGKESHSNTAQWPPTFSAALSLYKSVSPWWKWMEFLVSELDCCDVLQILVRETMSIRAWYIYDDIIIIIAIFIVIILVSAGMNKRVWYLQWHAKVWEPLVESVKMWIILTK